MSYKNMSYKKGHKGYWLDKKMPAKNRKVLSDAQKRIGNKPPTGYLDKNPNWKGGISYKIALKLTLERDDYTCQICGLRDPDVLEVDHRLCRSIHPELFQELSNLWTLCANCHKRKTKKDWELIKAHRLKQQ